jgi:hypothetical protein
MLLKSSHLLLLFYKTSIPIYAFLPELQNLKNASAVDFRSSYSQLASHGFLHCLVSFVVVTSQVIFQGPEQVVVRGGQIRNVGWMGEHFPAILFASVSKLEIQRVQTFLYPKISIISWTVWCPTPSGAAISLNVILQSCLISSSTFCLLRSVTAVLCRPQLG